MATPSHFNEARAWLASALEQSASWREEKAEEYPEDRRNGRAATALRGAAYYVRAAQASAGVQRIAELIHDSAASGIDLPGPKCEFGLPGTESERVAARYFFDHYGGSWNNESHEELLEDLYRAMLRDLRDQEVTPTSPLGVRLRSDDWVSESEGELPVNPFAALQSVAREYIDHRTLSPEKARLTLVLTPRESFVITGWRLIEGGWAAVFTDHDEMRLVRLADIAGFELGRAEAQAPKPPIGFTEIGSP
jgi:hypothetical protein